MKINRLFEIIYLLLARETITAKELADYFEVSRRTIYRDIETLSAAGIPIYTNRGKGGGVSVLANYVLDRTLLTDAEKETIISSMSALNQVHPEGGAGIARIRTLLNSQQPDWVEVDFSSWNHGQDEAKMFNELKTAILQKKLIRCEYYNAKSEVSQRQLEPLKLCYTSFAWYLYAYCQLRQDFRFFKLKRIKHLTVLAEQGSHEVVSNVLAQHKDYRRPGKKISVSLELAASQTYRVIEEFSEYTQTEAGNYLVTIEAETGNDLFSYLLSFGPECKILAPKVLKNQFSSYLKEIQTLYL